MSRAMPSAPASLAMPHELNFLKEKAVAEPSCCAVRMQVMRSARPVEAICSVAPFFPCGHLFLPHTGLPTSYYTLGLEVI